MTTTPAMNLVPANLNLSSRWTIGITPDNADSVAANEFNMGLLNQLDFSTVTPQDDNANNPYAILEGTISATLLGMTLFSAPIYGTLTAGVITFHFHLEDFYVFTGLRVDATTISHGSIYKDDPTDEGSWSGTAQQAGNTNPS